MEIKYLATISIMIKDRKMHAQDVNKILGENGDMILARLGIHVQKLGIEHCSGFITIVINEPMDKIKKLTDEINNLYGIVAKANIFD